MAELTTGVTDGNDFVFWTELLRGWLHTQLSNDEKRKWPWILPNNVELPPPVLQILFANQLLVLQRGSPCLSCPPRGVGW